MQACYSPQRHKLAPAVPARADRGKEHQSTLTQAAFRLGIAGRQRNGAGGCVAVAPDIHHHLFRWKTEPFHGRVNDAAIRLMRNQNVDVFDRQIISSQQRGGHLIHLVCTA